MAHGQAFGGKRFTYTLGKYPLLTLAATRVRRSEIKQMLQDGGNPAADKKIQKKMARAQIEDTFKAIAEDWYQTKAGNRSKAWDEAIYGATPMNFQSR